MSDYLKPGDHVCRRADVMNQNSKMRHGMVLSRYSETDSRGHFYPELYKVRWNDGVEQKGYLRHGLEKMRYQP